MARLTVSPDYSYDMRQFNLTTLLFGDSYYRSTRMFVAHVGDDAVVFNGTGFKYDHDGYPTAGWVTSIGQFVSGELAATTDGLHASAVGMLDAALTYSLSDDHRIQSRALGGNDVIKGANGDDVLLGFGGNDKISGKDGADSIDGGAGNDTITGGRGEDSLRGGAGADHFVYSHLSDGSSTFDIIYGFSVHQHDKIDLSQFDANVEHSGHDDAHYIGRSSFRGHAGELRYQHVAGHTYVEIDTDGDKGIDFIIRIYDNVSLHKGDFIV